jgi:hypothetical protein
MDLLHTGLTSLNIILILILIYYFYQSYIEVGSRFTLGLLIFSVVFLVNAIFRCPVFISFFTDADSCPYTLYYTVAAGFEFVALLTLIYLVRE